MAILLIAMRPERVTQKVEALLTRLLDAGLRLIQGDPHPCDHLPRPIQCLSRFPATENHEVVRVVYDMSVKLTGAPDWFCPQYYLLFVVDGDVVHLLALWVGSADCQRHHFPISRDHPPGMTHDLAGFLQGGFGSLVF